MLNVLSQGNIQFSVQAGIVQPFNFLKGFSVIIEPDFVYIRECEYVRLTVIGERVIECDYTGIFKFFGLFLCPCFILKCHKKKNE